MKFNQKCPQNTEVPEICLHNVRKFDDRTCEETQNGKIFPKILKKFPLTNRPGSAPLRRATVPPPSHGRGGPPEGSDARTRALAHAARVENCRNTAETRRRRACTRI